MSKINTLLVALLIVVLMLYAVYMNIQLRQTVSQYEAMNLEMTKKFAKLNEERVREREELSRKEVSADENVVAAEQTPIQTVTKSVETRSGVSKPAAIERQISEARITKKEAEQAAVRARAEKTKAEVEAMLGGVKTGPEPWEEREPHL